MPLGTCRKNPITCTACIGCIHRTCITFHRNIPIVRAQFTKLMNDLEENRDLYYSNGQMVPRQKTKASTKSNLTLNQLISGFGVLAWQMFLMKIFLETPLRHNRR